ncbi:hypothetical protein [Acidisoma sp. 7E03]
MAKPAGKKSASPSKTRVIRRGLVVLAVAILWAAGHQPDSFTPASTLIWTLGMVTVALLARAAFAVMEPVMKLGAGILLLSVQRHRPAREDES